MQGTHSGGYFPSEEMQLAYSTAPTDCSVEVTKLCLISSQIHRYGALSEIQAHYSVMRIHKTGYHSIEFSLIYMSG